MVGIAFRIVRLLCLKIRFGKRIEIKNIRTLFKWDTEVKVWKDGILSLGKVRVHSNVHLECCSGKMSIGSDVSFNRNCTIVCKQKISIGNNCFFGPNVCVYDHDHVFDTEGIRIDQFNCSDIIIEDSCWIGAGSIVLKGTHIGRNSVIGAGTVVKGRIPPNSMVTSFRKNNIFPIRHMLFWDQSEKANNQ